MPLAHSGRVSDLLGRFPGDIALKPSELRNAFTMSVAILVFVGALFYMVQHRSFGGILLGLLGIALAWLMAFTTQSLTLDRDGFRHRYFGGFKRYRWNEVRNFRAWDTWDAVMLSFDHGSGKGLLAKSKSAMLGGNAGVYGNFGLTGDELVALMEGWRTLALSAEN